MFFGTEFILISLICLSVTSTKRLTAILKISVLLYSPTSNLTNQLVGFVIFICAKILKKDVLYWTSSKNSLELTELSSINKVSLSLVLKTLILNCQIIF